MDKKDGYKFDVYTEHDWQYNFESKDGPQDSGDAIGLTDGFIESDCQNGIPNPFFKVLRESQFPLERLLKAGAIDIKKAVASEARDEKYIKNTITNQNEDDDPPEHHDNYEKLNNLIRGFIVGSNFQRIIRDQWIESDQKSIYFDIFKLSSVTVIYLDVRGNTPFDDSIATQLAVSLPSRITSFTFSSDRSSITQHGILAIVRGLATLTTLEELKLRDNNIDDETCLVLANAMINNITLKTLDLDKNNIGDEGAIALATALRFNNNLRKLRLSSNKVSDEGAKILADALTVNQTLQILDVNGNNIRTNGMLMIANALKLRQNNSNEAKVKSKLSQLSRVLQNINESKVKFRRSKLMIVGEGRTGKTAFANSVMGNDFKDTESTVGIDRFECAVNYAALNKGEWNTNVKKIEKEYENAIAERVKESKDDDDVDWDVDWDIATPSLVERDFSIDRKNRVEPDFSADRGSLNKVREKLNSTAFGKDNFTVKREKKQDIDSKNKFDEGMIIKYLGDHIEIGENILINILDYGGQTIFNVSVCIIHFFKNQRF
jgi:GTPase SAR1 family protein